MLITPSFKKSLIVEQFQGNYLEPKPYILLMLMLMFLSRLFSLEHKLHLLMLILASLLGLGLNEGERRRQI